jgi:hypothetical protein
MRGSGYENGLAREHFGRSAGNFQQYCKYQGSHFWVNFPKTGKLAYFWGAIWGIAFWGEIFWDFFQIRWN